MSFVVTCTCNKQFRVHDRYAGKTGKCPFCGTAVLLKPGEDWVPTVDAAKQALRRRSLFASGDQPAAEPDAAPQQAPAVRQVIQLFCPTCGTRYREGQRRCSFCHAPLTPEEIAAAKAANRPPLIPWLPRVHVSGPVKTLTVLALLGLALYAYIRPSLQRRAFLKAELALVERVMTASDLPEQWSVQPLSQLTLEMPGYPWGKEAEVKAFGKWRRGDVRGFGTYDRKNQTLRLRSDSGQTYFVWLPPLLHLAIYARDPELVKELLKDPGCDVNHTDTFDGGTPLHVVAASKGDPADMATLLLDHGAKLRVEDAYGSWPIELARDHGNQKVFDVLRGREVKSRQKPAPGK